MATRRATFPDNIDNIVWNDMITTKAIPLIDTTDSFDDNFRFNSDNDRWEMYISGVKVASIDASGNLRIRGTVMSEETGL